MLDRVAGIAIEKGPMPAMKQSAGRGRISERTLQVRTAIEKMPADSWFVVPETSLITLDDEKGAKKNTVYASGIRKFLKDSVADGKEWAVGVAVGVRETNGALIVRKTADIATKRRAQPIPG